MRVGYFNSRLVKASWLERLTEAKFSRITTWIDARKLTHMMGWVGESNHAKAREYASKHSLLFWSLDEGFLKSSLFFKGRAAFHSLIVDSLGIYYDASNPSDLEQLILQIELNAAEQQRALHAIDLLRHCLSEYNHTSHKAAPVLSGTAVLVVDQAVDDASIKHGLANADTFRQMLSDAIADNPGAQVLVKMHPEVITGKKKGHLLALAQTHDCVLIGEDLPPCALLDRVQSVYVVTSQLGFEALIVGKEVHCYGMPFYAGWGLTQDRLKCERRSKSRTLGEIFTAAYLRYCRYINPYTGQRCEFEDSLALIADQKRAGERVRADWIALDFAGWKRSFIARFLARHKRQVRWHSSPHLDLDDKCRVLAWASKVTAELVQQCCDQNRALWRIEDGFVRSVGLGVDLVDPLSLVIDSRGIYYDASAPSDLEQLLQDEDISRDLIERAARLRQQLVDLKLSKYNVGSAERLNLPADKRLILVPGQVETDASIRRGSPELRTNAELLEAVRAANPDAYIIYKPHPDVLGGGRIGQLCGSECFDLEVHNIAMPELLEQVDEVHTLTSLTGFEALLRGVPVATYGLPFYAGWGLTADRFSCQRRTRIRTLDELVAATLILYPLYVDPVSGDHINAETAIDLLARQRDAGYRPNLRTRFWRLFRQCI